MVHGGDSAVGKTGVGPVEVYQILEWEKFDVGTKVGWGSLLGMKGAPGSLSRTDVLHAAPSSICRKKKLVGVQGVCLE